MDGAGRAQGRAARRLPVGGRRPAGLRLGLPAAP